MTEKVVLLNQLGQAIGQADKAEIHSKNTPLHLAFSCFLFTDSGDLLLQQRAKTKKTWPGVWSNSCCGHPTPGENPHQAVTRRVRQELGIENQEVKLILPDFRYKAKHLGVVENEICPVYVGKIKEEANLNPDEVEAVRFVPWKDFISGILHHDEAYREFSVWCKTEATILHHHQGFHAWFVGHFGSYPDVS